jgi:hypothetical protein
MIGQVSGGKTIMGVTYYVCKPIAKFLLKNPLVGFSALALIYLYIAYRVLVSGWEYKYGKTASKEEIAARWQQHMSYTRTERTELTKKD